MRTGYFYLLLILQLTAVDASGLEDASAPYSEPDPLIARIIERVDGSKLIGDVEWLVSLGNRYATGDNINSVGDSLSVRLERVGLEMSAYWFDFLGPLFNVIGTKLGTVHPDSFFVVCAHYDARSQIPYVFTPGADDDGSGVAAVLTIAELMAPYNTRYSIQYILFSAEEMGMEGSHEWAEAMAIAGFPIVGGLNCDMIGWWAEGVDFDLDVLTNAQSRWIADTVANAAALYTGMPVVVHQAEDYYTGDFKSFWDNGYSCVGNKEGFGNGFPDFNPWYHTTYDLPEYLSPEMLAGSTKVVLATLATLAEIDGWVADVGEASLPVAQLHSFPNPFNARTMIRCTAPGPDRMVWLEIFDLRGRRVGRRSLPIREGEGQVLWDARDRTGAPLPSGTYFFRVDLGAETARGRVQLVE